MNELTAIFGMFIGAMGLFSFMLSKDADGPDEWCIKISFKYPLRITGVICIYISLWIVGTAIGR